MAIGHSKKSATFVPGVGQGEEFVFLDCPGFLDNRGPEINIANAVNIKLSLHGAASVKVIVIINYHSIKADRGREQREAREDSSRPLWQRREHRAVRGVASSSASAKWSEDHRPGDGRDRFKRIE